MYIDESGIEVGAARERGWGKKGVKLAAKKSGKYYERINIIAGYVNKAPIAPMTFNGSCDTKVFESWVEKILVKELKSGQIIIMDNASFHKSQRTKKLIESAGCELLFLPPYSPELNPIEKFWANMKRWIKDNITTFDNIFKALEIFFCNPNST